MAISKLNMSFVNGTTVIDASMLQAFQNKINELVDSVNGSSSGGSSSGGSSGGGSSTPTPVIPTITLDTTTKKVSLSATSGLTIKYSTTGGTPSINYSSAIDVSEGASIKAISTNGSASSDIPKITVTFDEGANTIALVSSVSGTIRYTEDGSNPTSSSTAYSEGITPTTGKTYKVGVYSGSSLVSEIATIQITA